MTDTRLRNRALVEHILLPTVFMTVALLGGVRVAAETGALIFLPPPLVTLVLAVMLAALFVRGRLIDVDGWLSSEMPALRNVSHALTLAALFFASAQSFNSVLPEGGLLRWMFSFFFLWTLWNDLFAPFDARRLLRRLTVLFATAFLLKHMLLATLFAPEGGWLKRLAGVVLEGVTLGTIDSQAFAPATGYISFFTLALYVLGLFLLPPAPGDVRFDATRASDLLERVRRLPPAERAAVRRALDSDSAAMPSMTLPATPEDEDDETVLSAPRGE